MIEIIMKNESGMKFSNKYMFKDDKDMGTLF